MTITYPPLHTLLGISPHGIFTMFGIIAGALLLLRELDRRGANRHVIETALFWAIPFGIVGARADYVISHPADFSSLTQILQVWQGGIALFGGLIAGVTVGAIVAYRGGYHVPRLLDVAAPALALAVTVGRVGDLLLLDHLGKPTTSQWALAYRIPRGAQLAPGFGPSPAEAPPTGASCHDVGQFYAGCTYHLTPAYDLVGALLLFILLVWLRGHVAYRAGVAISTWAAWYGTQRFLLDFSRGIDERPVVGLTGTQLLAVVLAASGATVLLLVRTRGRGWGHPGSRQGPLVRVSARPPETGSPA